MGRILSVTTVIDIDESITDPREAVRELFALGDGAAYTVTVYAWDDDQYSSVGDPIAEAILRLPEPYVWQYEVTFTGPAPDVHITWASKNDTDVNEPSIDVALSQPLSHTMVGRGETDVR